MFSICNRFTFVFVSLQLPTAHLSSVNAFESRIAIRNCLLAKNTHTFVGDVFLWIHGKWHKFAMSYIAIQSFVVGINVAIQNCSVGRCYFVRYFFAVSHSFLFDNDVLLFHEHHSTHVVLYICATNTQPSNQLKHFFSRLFLSRSLCVCASRCRFLRFIRHHYDISVAFILRGSFKGAINDGTKL